MAHIGNLLKRAISAGGYNQAEVADKVGKGRNTIQRWLNTPNLGLKEVREVQVALPNLYMKGVYDALEEVLGHQIPDNPYRMSKKPVKEKENQAGGIRVMLDAEAFAGYRIPSDFITRVRSVLEDAQEEGEYETPPPPPAKKEGKKKK